MLAVTVTVGEIAAAAAAMTAERESWERDRLEVIGEEEAARIRALFEVPRLAVLTDDDAD